MKSISLRHLSPAERQLFVARQLTGQDLGTIEEYNDIDPNFDIPPMPVLKSKPMPAVENHVSRKSYAAFKLYMVFVALGYVYWAYGVFS